MSGGLNLRALGWQVDFPRDGSARTISIFRENGEYTENAVITVMPSSTEENQALTHDSNYDSKTKTENAVTNAVIPKQLILKENDSNDSNDSNSPSSPSTASLDNKADWEEL